MSILKWNSHHGNPLVEIDSESPDLQPCESLIIRISAPNLTTEDKNLFIFKHLDGKIDSLRVSAQECPLCRIILGESNGSHAILFRTYRINLNLEDARSFSVYRETDSLSSKGKFQLFQSPDRPDMNKSERILYVHHDTNPRLIKAPEGHIISPLWLQLAQIWIADCVKHTKCTHTRPTLPLPKRVLDIRCMNSIHLHDSTEPEFFPYATLSYCWGAGVPLKTTTTNLSSHRDNIPFSSFPKTLQDSVQLANGLGFRYLWIDALCIIQDDERDWAEQAAKMTSIYEGCSLNIAILDSGDCDSGILPTIDDISVNVGTLDNWRESEYSQAPRVQIRAATEGIRIGTVPHEAETCLLSTRGWTFQETLVSVSTLFISRNGLSWDCTSVAHAQNGQTIEEYHELMSIKSTWYHCTNKSPLLSAVAAFQQTPHEDFRDPMNMDAWYDWVAEFSKRSLSKPADKLPAIAGLASELAALRGCTYVAGLWTQDLHVGLTWSAITPETLVRHEAPLRAPSWSWASVDGGVKYPNLITFKTDDWHVKINEDEDLKILDVVVDEHLPGTFGTVSGGRIEAVATMYSLATVPGLDGRGLRFQFGSHPLPIQLDESLAGLLESGNSSHTSKTQTPPYWLTRVCSSLCVTKTGYDSVFYLALKQNVAAAEGDLPTFSRIGLLEVGQQQQAWRKIKIEIIGGIRKRITIL